VESKTYKDSTGYVAKISKQNVKHSACFLLASCNKMQKKRGKLRIGLLNKKGPALDDLKFLFLSRWQKTLKLRDVYQVFSLEKRPRA
jgi:hypothetical protein